MFKKFIISFCFCFFSISLCPKQQTIKPQQETFEQKLNKIHLLKRQGTIQKLQNISTKIKEIAKNSLDKIYNFDFKFHNRSNAPLGESSSRFIERSSSNSFSL